MRMRLQRVLAQAGLASRRQGEQWIQAGRVSVNGKVVTTPGTQADPIVDRIAVDGKVINGLLSKQTPEQVVLRDLAQEGKAVTIAQDQIDAQRTGYVTLPQIEAFMGQMKMSR